MPFQLLGIIVLYSNPGGCAPLDDPRFPSGSVRTFCHKGLILYDTTMDPLIELL
jgi:hypothetical protein